MARLFLLCVTVAAAFLHTPGQVEKTPLEKGKIEDLRGATKVYIGVENRPPWLLYRLVTDLRKEIPQLTFVSVPDDADMWLLISEERVEVVPNASLNTSSTRISFSSNLEARIISNQSPGHARLVKKISMTRGEMFGSGGYKGSGANFARKFAELYHKANAAGRAETTRLPPHPNAPPSLGRQTPAEVAARNPSSDADKGPEEVGDDDVVRVNTSLVTVHATVLGRDGKPAPRLGQEDFSVYEDNIKQDLAMFEPVDRPFTIVLLIDVSGSVRNRLEAISAAANALITSLREDDQIVVLTFGSEITEVLKLTKTRDLRDNGMVLSPGGGTRLYDAVDLVIARYLRRLPGRKAVVMLTDGIDSMLSHIPQAGSVIADSARNLHDAEELDALFYPVQYDTWIETVIDVPEGVKAAEVRKLWEERSTEYLQALAHKTGGRLYRADSISNLAPAFAAIVEELSRQYSLGYYPRRLPQEGERRSIKVRVSSPDLVVRSRDGYISKSPGTKPAGPK